MFASGKPIWYLWVAILTTALGVFTVVGLSYDRYAFINTQDRYQGTLATFLSTDTIKALKEDARLHHALLGLTDSIATASSNVGKDYGLNGVETFGKSLAKSITELRNRNDVDREGRVLVDEMGQALGDMLSGLGVNTTGGVGGIVGNIGSSLVDGLATPALFLGLGVGYVHC